MVAVSYKLRFLTLSGAVVAFVIGWIVFGLGRFAFSSVMLFFFFSSSLLSNLGSAQKSKLTEYAQKVNQRNARQILANGLVPTLLLIAWFNSQESIFILLFLTSLAAATADTWATEIGVLSKSEPRSILGFKDVPKGTSGGVSILDTVAGFGGSVAVVILGLLVFSLSLQFPFTLQNALLAAVLGLPAQIFDSILGASFQAKYRCLKCERICEESKHCPGAGTELISGWKWMNNNVVNFLSVVFAVFVAWLVTN